MAKFVVKLPFKGRSLRRDISKTNETTNEAKKGTSNERVKRYRDKLKNDPNLNDKVDKLKEQKRKENQAYRLKMKQKREQDDMFNEIIKEKNRVRMQKLRLKHSEKERKQKAKTNACSKKRTLKTPTKLRKIDTKRKIIERAAKALPQERQEWAETVKQIVDNATPKRKSMLSFATEMDEMKEVVGTNKVGRPNKHTEEVKKRLAYSEEAASNLWKSPKTLKQYKTRKHAQVKRISKRSVHRKSWKPKVETFLEDHSRVMPNKKDTITIGNEAVAKRHLLYSKVELFKKFKKRHPEFDRKFGTFLKMIPKQYRHLDLTCRRVCVCSKDYNIEQKIEALNKLATRKSHPELKATSRHLSDMTVCPYQELPDRCCVDRKCSNCGTSAIQDMYSPLIENSTEELKYHQWETRPESYVNKKGSRITTKRWVQVEHKTNAQDLVNSVASDMELFTAHMFRADYQHMMEKNVMVHPPINQCVVVMDFSENICLQPQDEIESAHWTNKQVTLHPIHIVRHAKESTAEEPVIMKESLIILSESLTHNSAAVYVFTKQLLIHLKKNPGPCEITKVHRFTDNCATQYKSKEAFSHVKLLEDDHEVEIVYHYTEAGHGKGPSDGLGAAIKKRLERLILGGKVINNGYQAYLALTQTQREGIDQTIIYVPERKLTKEMPPKVPGIKTIKGTQKFHMVRQHAGKMECADLSCTCEVCIGDQEGPCYFSKYRHEQEAHSLFKTMPSRSVNDSGDGPIPASCAGQTDDRSSSNRFEPADFVAVTLSSDKQRQVFIAKVLEMDQNDVKLRFVRASRPSGIYTWPATDDIAWQPHSDVLKTLTAPELLPGRGLKMKFKLDEIQCVT